MARVFHYDNTLPDVQLQRPQAYKDFLREHGTHSFLWGSAAFQSQAVFGNATLAGTKWELNEEFNWDYQHRYESETMVRRFVDKRQFLSLFIGADNRREFEGTRIDGKKMYAGKNLATFGATYFLPLFITAEGRVDHTEHFRFQVGRQDLELTRRARFNFLVNTDREYAVGLGYILTRNLALSGNYDSDYGWGAGIRFVY